VKSRVFRFLIAMHFGIYSVVRIHKTPGTTPAVAAELELERWSLERVVEVMHDYDRRAIAGTGFRNLLDLPERVLAFIWYGWKIALFR
jgi:hypothetical protein